MHTFPLQEANLALEERLARLQLAHSQLEQQHAAAQSLQQRLSHLESEQQSSAVWFDALSAELADKSAEVAEAQAALAAARAEGEAVAARLSEAQAALEGAQAAREHAESSWQVGISTKLFRQFRHWAA